jgi:hypothetical protein
MIAAIAMTLVAVAGGTIVTYAYDEDAPLVSRLAYGAATGLVAAAAIGFILANLIGSELAAILSTVVVAVPLLALALPGPRARVAADLRATAGALVAARREPSLSTIGRIVYLVALTGLLLLVFGQVIVEHDAGLATGYVNNLGDMPFHVGVTSSFAYGQNFHRRTQRSLAPGSPILSVRLPDGHVRGGGRVAEGGVPGRNVTLGFALVGVLYQFTRTLTADRLAGFIAPILVLFSGGLGWLQLIGGARGRWRRRRAAGCIDPRLHDQSGGTAALGNAITTLLVTQRSLLMGLPIALLAFILL